jgi:hypothetical protein
MVLDLRLWVVATAALLAIGLAVGEPLVVLLAAFPLPNALRATRALAAGGPSAEYFRAGFAARLAPAFAYVALAGLLLTSALHVAPRTTRALERMGKGGEVAAITSSLSTDDDPSARPR